MRSIIFIPLLAASSLFAQEPDSTSAIFSMREAERDFAKASVTFGRHAAFIENFAEKSMIFTDKWNTNGKQVCKEQKPVPVVLKWEPEYMDISLSRDFGISTGPWEAQECRPNTESISTGYFLTVWQKNMDGRWLVLLDAGCGTPPKPDSGHSVSFPAGADKDLTSDLSVNNEKVNKELIDMEMQHLKEWLNKPAVSAYSSFLAQDVRFLREGHLPSTNRDTINTWIGKMDPKTAWTTSGSGVAGSGDLGFTCGILHSSDNSKSLKGHYVRIWKKQSGNRWAIIIEMMKYD